MSKMIVLEAPVLDALQQAMGSTLAGNNIHPPGSGFINVCTAHSN